MSDPESVEDIKVSISYKPLFELLQALESRGPELREIQALTGSSVEELTGKTCLSKVLDEFNAEVRRINNQAKEPPPPLPTDTLYFNYQHVLDIDKENQTEFFIDGKKLSPKLRPIDNVVFGEELRITGMQLEISSGDRAVRFPVALRKGEDGRVSIVDEDGNCKDPQFNKGFEVRTIFSGDPFDLTSYITFDAKKGMLKVAIASIQSVGSINDLEEHLEFVGTSYVIKVTALHIAGTYSIGK